MTFDDILAQVQALLQREQRLSYRALQRRFALGANLSNEQIAQKLAVHGREGQQMTTQLRDGIVKKTRIAN